mmetsp:Transcript_8231/g.19901  ORF Transcript_8231/g.19901 Transcript_8231/m.19901 type:complete len:468 (-) Transcript_8231:87-1490(-)
MGHPGSERVRPFAALLAAHYSVRLPDSLKRFCPPSLTLLARTYVDSVDAVQQAARVLMDGTLRRMPLATQEQLIQAWSPRVLRAAGATSGDNANTNTASAAQLEIHSPAGIAVLVVSLLACKFGHALTPDVTRTLAEVWVRMLGAPLDTHRRLAGEMVGMGFHLWEPTVGAQAGRLIKQLFGLMAATAGLHVHGGHAGALRGAGRLSLGLGGNPYLGALISIGSCQPALFAALMGDVAVQLDIDATRRSAAIVTLVSLIRAKSSLARDMPAIVEAILRPLDPSLPKLREGCLQAGTLALRELVKRYPMAAFHQTSQKLGIGTVTGVVLIYDLRTATKWRILQGHNGAVSAVAFAAGGDLVASFSAADSTLRWWQAGSSTFFGYFGLHGHCHKVLNVDVPDDEEDADASASSCSTAAAAGGGSGGAAGGPMPNVGAVARGAGMQLEWTSPSTVMLLGRTGKPLGFYTL